MRALLHRLQRIAGQGSWADSDEELLRLIISHSVGIKCCALRPSSCAGQGSQDDSDEEPAADAGWTAGGDQALRPGIVHRLDKGTTGVAPVRCAPVTCAPSGQARLSTWRGQLVPCSARRHPERLHLGC